ncbi:PstS family phosphate ABC transporter substrate-binding protein [Synechococcus sp. PCC 7336]|uniref:PstS family phosphate ABC transporter substrate-binding protein n=1 Tax=Synechococcus sp. PCC 7336 TaxID=195250 RepID=UPI0003451FC8|nr:PstS family phosphate ABC transporter substrate-binding protein [Synechococcus sp. PCC 7336]
MTNRNCAIAAGLLAAATLGVASVVSADNHLSGDVLADGSSTVGPVTIAAAEGFRSENPSVQVSVGTSGSGGGFKKFCVGETDISNASRVIKQSEIDICAENGVEFVEIPVAFDGLAVVTHKDNTFAQCLSVEQLNYIWNADAEGEVTNWSQVKDADFPSEDFALFAPGVDSGTFDYFVEAILDEDDIRADFTPSEDDNVIVTGVAGSPGGLGFFGLAFYEENSDILNLVAIDNGSGCIAPSEETVANGTYNPLARPLFIYVNTESADESQVEAFVDFYLENAADLASSVGYIGLPEDAYASITKHWEARGIGSNFQDVEPGTPIDELFGEQ